MVTVIANLKGGTGKSTVTFNIAVWLATRDVPVRVFDLDPQSTLKDVNDIRKEDGYEPALEVSSNLHELKPDDNYEFIVDVGTADMDAFLFAICQADRIIVPVPPSQADIWSTQRFIKIIKEVTANDAPPLYGFINRADTHHAVTETSEAEMALSSIEQIESLGIRWCQRTVYRRAFSEGLAVFEMHTDSKASREVNDLATMLYPILTSSNKKEAELCL